MKKENQRVAISKRLLKDAVMQLLQKKHIDDINVSELCEKAQINRTTFYRHYQTPHDVLLEIELDFMEKLYHSPSRFQDISDMKKYVVRMCNFLYDNKEMVKLFISNNMNKDFMAIFQNFVDHFLESRTIQYKGHSVDPDTLRLLSTFFASGGYALIRQWLMEEIPKTPNEIADLVLGSFNKNISFL